MAKAIRRIEREEPSPQERDAQALMEMMGAVAQHKAALVSFLDILGELHEAGLLDIVRGLLKSRHQIGVIGLTQLNKSGAQHTIRNGMGLVQFLGRLDPDDLTRVLTAVGTGLQQAQPSPKGMGMLGMIGALREPDVNASMSLLINFLRGMGGSLTHPQTH